MIKRWHEMGSSLAAQRLGLSAFTVVAQVQSLVTPPTPTKKKDGMKWRHAEKQRKIKKAVSE